MRDFDYAAPQSLSDTLQLLSSQSTAHRVLAGGTDLIDQIRTGRLEPDIVVDIKNIPELNVLTVDDAGLRIGAAVPCYRIHAHPRIETDFSALADACRIIGGVQIQSRASVGGNLCNSSPAADSIPALIALNATAVIASPDGQRSIPVSEFCIAPGRNVMVDGELLVAILIPPRPPHSGSHYRRFIPRNEMDIAVVGVGTSVVLDASHTQFESVRIGLGAVAPTPLYAEHASSLLAGQPVNDSTIAQAVDAARSIVKPIDDLRGTVDFRRHVVGVLVERTIRQAVDRAVHKG